MFIIGSADEVLTLSLIACLSVLARFRLLACLRKLSNLILLRRFRAAGGPGHSCPVKSRSISQCTFSAYECVPGGPDLTLTLNGGGFVPASVVNWNGKAFSTTFVSGSQLKATVPTADTAAATTASVTVSNPTPGGGTSDVVFFPVHDPVTNVTFTNFPQVSGDFSPGYIGAVGDFNGDGKLDVAGIAPGPPGSGANAIFVALGNGDGSFAAPGIFSVGNEPAGMVAADFNGDGKLDLAVANTKDSTVSILLGNVHGTFRRRRLSLSPLRPSSWQPTLIATGN